MLASTLMFSALPQRAFAQSAPAPDATPATAQAPAADPAPPAAATQDESKGFWEGTELGGLIDVYYDYYSTKPEGDALYRLFDTKHNQFNLNMAEVWLAKAPTADSRAGFKLRATAGSAAALINAFEPGGPELLKNVEEAYVSYLAPVGKGLQFDVGKFVTPLGAEVIEAKDNWNYSRSLLFALAIPFYHAGVRVSLRAERQVQRDRGSSPTAGTTSSTTTAERRSAGRSSSSRRAPCRSSRTTWPGPNSRTTATTGVRFPIRPSPSRPTKALTLMGNYDYGHDTFAGVGGHWQGFAGYAKFQANESVAIIPRFEWYDDEAGFTTGTPQTLKEATITLEAKALDNLLWRIEYPRRLLRSGRLQERRWRLQGSAALHRHRHAVLIQLQGEIARTGLASVRYSPMATLRPKPSPAVLLDAARRELGDEIVRGEGGASPSSGTRAAWMPSSDSSLSTRHPPVDRSRSRRWAATAAATCASTRTSIC